MRVDRFSIKHRPGGQRRSKRAAPKQHRQAILLRQGDDKADQVASDESFPSVSEGPRERLKKWRRRMNMIYIPALASFSGSASGTLASILTNWVTQRRKDRVRHTLRAAFQREELYRSFIEEASRLYADALVNDNSEVSKLVGLYAFIARMKILSSDAVVEAAEKAARLILETYLSPNRTFVDLPELINEMDPLRDFSEACRRELQVTHTR
jgi:hypothetical protein